MKNIVYEVDINLDSVIVEDIENGFYFFGMVLVTILL